MLGTQEHVIQWCDGCVMLGTQEHVIQWCDGCVVLGAQDMYNGVMGVLC